MPRKKKPHSTVVQERRDAYLVEDHKSEDKRTTAVTNARNRKTTSATWHHERSKGLVKSVAKYGLACMDDQEARLQQYAKDLQGVHIALFPRPVGHHVAVLSPHLVHSAV